MTAISVAMTAMALFGFSFSHSFLALCLWAIPYGLGAGSVDASLNNYVALNYASRHMSWLHCMWGVGASAGPYVGTCLMPPLFGLIANHISIVWLPAFLLVVLVLMVLMHERLCRKTICIDIRNHLRYM